MGLKHGIIFTTHRSNNRRSNQSQVCANSFLFLCIFHQHVLEDDQIICTRTNMYWMINMYWMMNGYSMMIIIYICTGIVPHEEREWMPGEKEEFMGTDCNCTLHWQLHCGAQQTALETALYTALHCAKHCTAMH